MTENTNGDYFSKIEQSPLVDDGFSANMQNYPQQEDGSRMKAIILVVAISACLFLGIGAYFAYTLLSNSPEKILKKMNENVGRINTLKTVFNLGEDMTIEMKLDINDENKKKLHYIASVSDEFISAEYDEMYLSENQSGKTVVSEFIVIGDKSYTNLRKGVLGNDKDDWVRTDMDSLDSSDSKNNTESEVIFEIIKKIDASEKLKKSSDEIRNSYIPTSNITLGKRLSVEKNAEVKTYKYSFAMKKVVFMEYVKNLLTPMSIGQDMDAGDFLDLSEIKDELVRGEITIEDKSFLPVSLYFEDVFLKNNNNNEDRQAVSVEFGDYKSNFQINTPEKYILIPDLFKDANMRARKASIKSQMSSTVPAGIICQDAGGEVLSGKGGDPICNKGDILGGSVWPTSEFCGETTWTVFRGTSENWDVTINCRDFTDCNGPKNAICSGVGCKFFETCE